MMTHEITIPGTRFRCYVNADADKVDLAKIVKRIASARDKRRRGYQDPVVRQLEPGEAEALGPKPCAPRNKFGYPL